MLYLKQIYLKLEKWIKNNKIYKKRRLYLKIVSNYYLYSDFINKIAEDLINKGINKSDIEMIHYYRGFNEHLTRIDIHIKNYGILTYRTGFQKPMYHIGFLFINNFYFFLVFCFTIDIIFVH